MGTSRAHVLHLPGTRFVAIRARGQRAHRTDVDTHAALFALEMILPVRSNDRGDAPVLNAQSPDVHRLTAHPHAAIAKDASWAVEKHDRRPLLFVFVILGLDKLRLGGAVGECHVLQFALAAGITYRTIQRMISQQHFHHGLTRLADFVAIRGDDHAFADHGCTGRLQFGHLLDLHQAHAASTLQRKIRVIAK